MTILWSFSYNSFVKFHGKKFGSHNMTVLYPNLCYNKVCYKGSALYYDLSYCGFTVFPVISALVRRSDAR